MLKNNSVRQGLHIAFAYMLITGLLSIIAVAGSLVFVFFTPPDNRMQYAQSYVYELLMFFLVSLLLLFVTAIISAKADDAGSAITVFSSMMSDAGSIVIAGMLVIVENVLRISYMLCTLLSHMPMLARMNPSLDINSMIFALIFGGNSNEMTLLSFKIIVGIVIACIFSKKAAGAQSE